MAYSYDKDNVKSQIKTEDVIDFLMDFGGDPIVRGNVIVSRTICHHSPDEECSHKLYYYENSGLFQCYTGGCEESSFDLFQLVIKIFSLQKHQDIDLNSAIIFIANRLGISAEYVDMEGEELDDWKNFSDYDKIKQIKQKTQTGFTFEQLPEYDNIILSRFAYLPIEPWLNEGITQEVMKHHGIGFYPGEEQITIPHYDLCGRLIGIRGRTVIKEEAERFGKYRPLKINNLLYNHPLSKNLYNLNNTSCHIAQIGKAIVFESEKSTMQYGSYFGIENDISVACCGSHFSAYQCELLMKLGAQEIVLALDRQFEEKNDDEFKRLVKNITNIKNKFKNYVTISAIFDKNMITSYKDSPTDQGAEKFLQLYKERIMF